MIQKSAFIAVPILIALFPIGETWGASLWSGKMLAEGVTGRIGPVNHGWYEETIFCSPHGSGTGDTSWTGNAGTRGSYVFSMPGGIPGGLWGIGTLRTDGVPALHVRTGINVPSGSDPFTFNWLQTDHYSVQFDQSYETEGWGTTPWVWGTGFYQTFTAVGTHVTRIATRLAGKNQDVHNLNFQVYRTHAGPPSSWTPVSPVRGFRVLGLDPIYNFYVWAAFRSHEANLVPGVQYAWRVWCADGNSESHQFGLFARPDGGTGYAEGHLWNGDSPSTGWDAYGYCSGGETNTLVNYAPVANLQRATILTWCSSFGQTFRASGDGLAAVAVPVTFGGGDPETSVTFQLFNSPGGSPVGPAKTARGAAGAFHSRIGAVWARGEAPLISGQTYYLHATSPGMNLWNLDEGYAYGNAFLDGVSWPQHDVFMAIGEYEHSGDGPTPTTTPEPTWTATPTPPSGPNHILNGDMESGVRGTGGAKPDHWTDWKVSGSPSYWYHDGYGIGDSAAPQIIGGAINQTLFDAGLYQRVTGLTPGNQYLLNGWVRVIPRRSLQYTAWIGVDLTGQTSNGAAATVQYWELGGPDWEALGDRSVTPTGSAVSIWLRCRNTSMAETFYANFDNLSLISVLPEITWTPSHTPPVTATNTPLPSVFTATSTPTPSGPTPTVAVGVSWPHNRVSNSTFGTGDLTRWTAFKVGGGGTTMNYRESATGLTAPLDGRAAGTDLGTNSSGWRTGIYQRIDGLLPGVEYRLRGDGQILNGSAGAGDPSIGDDLLQAFWVNGTQTDFTSSWPGSAQVISTLTGNASLWTGIAGNFTPTSESVIVGFAAYFTDPGNLYAANSSLVDQVKLRVRTERIWEVIYDGGYLPSLNSGPDDGLRMQTTGTSSPILGTADGSRVPVDAPSFLRFVDRDVSGSWGRHTYNQTLTVEDNGTLLMRVRRPVGAVQDVLFDHFRIGNGVDRIGLSIVGTIPGKWGIAFGDGSGETVEIGNEGQWHAVRITWELDGTRTRVRLYRDGETVPLADHLANQPASALIFRTHNSAEGKGEFDLDWLLVTGENAFAPDHPNSPVLPPGFREVPGESPAYLRIY